MILIYVALKMQVKVVVFFLYIYTFEDLKIRFSLCLIN